MCSPSCVQYILLTFLYLLIHIHRSQCQLPFSGPLSIRDFAVSPETNFNFDLSLIIPIPVLGNYTIDIEFKLPMKFRFMNSTIESKPIKIPYFLIPDPKPITFDLTNHNSYYSYQQDPYNYDSTYYDSDYNTPEPYYESIQPVVNENRRNLLLSEKKVNSYNNNNNRVSRKKFQNESQYNARRTNMTNAIRYYHRRHKRSLSEASVQHRMDLFTVIEETLNQYGFDGSTCICRAICELAEMEFLIESPAHEVIEHLLRVSRSHDPDGILVDYLEAEKYGHQSFKSNTLNACSKRYSNCPFSVFDRNIPSQH
ncbi:hypothetical protein BLOT_006226 [Blomia tropicalis]|nr:hypothetical protein BLOT_006226 [Blomia tropicalis]